MVIGIIKTAAIPLAMIIVGGLAWHALTMGIDGAVLMSAVVVIGGLGGYEVKSVLLKKESKTPPATK